MLFEGIGASVQNNLFKQLSPNYERTVFVLASNHLPAPESQGVTATMFNKDIWHPLCTRVNFSHLTEPHKNDEEFPTPVFGSIHGGSALKYGFYQRKETGVWLTGTPRRQTELSRAEAIGLARRNLKQLQTGCQLLEALPSNGTDKHH